MISATKMQGVYASKEMFEEKPARGEFRTHYISKTIWDLRYRSKEKISFRLFVLIKCTVTCLLQYFLFVAGKYRLGTVCTERWKTYTGLAPRR